jgi:hypothetical protein
MHRYRHYHVHPYRSTPYVRRPYRAARRTYRSVRHLPPPLLVLLVMLGVGVGVLMVITLMTLFMIGSTVLVPVLVAGLAVRAATRQRPPLMRTTPPRPPIAAPRRAVAPPPVADPWRTARTGFAELRQSYAEYECDPLAVLRLPALADVSVPSTARFIEAFAEAQALDTDAPPPPRHRAQYIAAVDRARRAWTAAREAAERIQASHLPEKERATIERVIRLLTTARESDNDAERLVAYAKAHNELVRLEKTGHFRLPRPARAVLDTASRGQLPAA